MSSLPVQVSSFFDVEPSTTNDSASSTLTPWTEGLPWDEERTLRHIHHHMELIVLSAYEIGRALVETKSHLGHGRFEDWVTERLPFSSPTARRYVQVAQFLTEHPRLREPLGKARLKNVLLLTSLPAELREQLVQDGHVAQVPAEELGTMPYVELRKLKEKLETELNEARTKEDKLTEKLQERDSQVAELSSRQRGAQSERVRDELARLRERIEANMDGLGLLCDHMATRWDELDPATRAMADGLLAWLHTYTQHEAIAFQARRGEDVPVWQLDELLDGDRPLKDAFPVPDHRRLPTFEESVPTPSEGGRGGLKVVRGEDLVPSPEGPPDAQTPPKKRR